MHVAVGPEPARTHVVENEPELSLMIWTLPVGVPVVPGEVSVTVAVHELP